jgi:gliding motility-associated-like protein
MRAIHYLLIALLVIISSNAYCQQDVDFHLNAHLLAGKKVLKVKRDYHDPYLWVLTSNDGVYRINSITLAVDDYTSAFTTYNNLQFTDIAGRSQDTVFIATNSANVIEYKKGTLKTIGQKDGLAGTINEVGMDYLFEKLNKNPVNKLDGLVLLMIATTTNIYYYDCLNEIVIPSGIDPANNHLFETTYRTQAYSDSAFSYGYDPSKQLSTVNRTPYTVAVGELWYKIPEFGYHIYTAYYTTGSYYSSYRYSSWNDVLYMNQLWGTETGLFQNNWDRSYFLSSDYRHYLVGIKVNKVTSIYGLTNFDTELPGTPTRENLLVATDKGLYFSSSGYLKFTSGNLHDYNTFTFDTDIGNQVINDVCVNATSYSRPVCEDAVWVAANDGLYYLRPDYGKYIGSKLLHAANFKDMPDSTSSITICSGTSVTGVINNNTFSGNSMQWYKDGKELPTESKRSLKITATGDYYAVLYDPCSTLHLETNHLRVQVISSPVFTFNYPDKLQFCDSMSTSLKTTYSLSYHYRWYTDGVLNGDTSYRHTAAKSGRYKVEVSACANSWVSSKEIEVDLVNLPVPNITLNKTLYCASDSATLSANVPADPGYSINWYRDGSVLSAFTNKLSIKTNIAGSYTAVLNSTISNCAKISLPRSLVFTLPPVYTFNYPDTLKYCDGTPITLKAEGRASYRYRWYKNGILTTDTLATLNINESGTYRIEVSTCAGSWVPSKAVYIDFVRLPVPAISSDKPVYCIGDNATLSIIIRPSPGYTINWLRDNEPVPANKNLSTITTNVAGNYMVSIVSNKANNDGTFCSQISTAQSLAFTPPPVVSIEKIVKTTFCEGQTVDLKANYTGGTIKWSTGESAAQISVTASGTYKATVTSPSGCQVDATIDVKFLPNPLFNVRDTTLCAYKQQTITLTAPLGFASYSWNGKAGTQSYQIASPQTVSLIVTDANGCQATKEIHIADQCPEVWIPNTFTPNNDGINDTWTIEGVGNDLTVIVKVYNRYGAIVYESKGYATAWNGEYRGKKLPTATYYYIITTKNGKQKFSGSITIIY